MDHFNALHSIIFSLVLTLRVQLWNCQEPAISLTPVNLTIHNDSSQQRLLVEWSIHANVYVSGMDVIHRMQVARSKKRNIILDEHYETSLSRADETFRWTWYSELPLECDSHSVRVRSAVIGEDLTADKSWGVWSSWKTHYGQNKADRRDISIYPHEKIVLEGSDVTFCCLPPRHQNVHEMCYRLEPCSVRSLSTGTESFVFTVRNVSLTASDGGNVICRTTARESDGTVLIVSKPPDEPADFSCETQDLKSLNCRWKPGPNYNFYRSLSVNNTLHEWLSINTTSCSRNECAWPIATNQQIYNFTLTARNILGERKINAIMTLTERIRPIKPTDLRTSSVTASHVVLSWTLKADYTSLLLHCQTDLGENKINLTVKGKPSHERYSVRLTRLRPHSVYNLSVRCMSESSLAGWSNWSQSVLVQTPENVPSTALDIWREVKDGEGGRVVTLYWKAPADFRANGIITHYTIRWWTLGGDSAVYNTTVPADQDSSAIHIGRDAHVVTATAQNGAGGSPAAVIKVPAAGGHSAQPTAERTRSKDGGVCVSWKPIPMAHGYVVEWCNAPRSPHCDLQWKKYKPSVHSDVITSSIFTPGVRYDFWIYASEEDGEHLLGRMTGYSEERASSVTPKAKISKIDSHSLSVDWSPYPTDDSQEGFVIGYNVYLKIVGEDCKMNKSDNHIFLDGSLVCRFYIGQPEKLQSTLTELKPNTKYEVAVSSLTGGGESHFEFVKADTPADVRKDFLSVILPAALSLHLVLLLLILGCLKREWLKEKCYPDIPDPKKSHILNLSGSKRVEGRNVIPMISTQKVDLIHAQESEICKDLKFTIYHPSDVIYTEIQKSGENSCSPNNTQQANPADKTSDDPRPPPKHLEFFNESYTTSEDTLENVSSSGYKPQADVPPVTLPSSEDHATFDYLRCPELDPVLDLSFVPLGSFSTFESESLSPTSVTSTTLILPD